MWRDLLSCALDLVHFALVRKDHCPHCREELRQIVALFPANQMPVQKACAERIELWVVKTSYKTTGQEHSTPAAAIPEQGKNKRAPYAMRSEYCVRVDYINLFPKCEALAA
jgi:hypothetical protein